MKNASEDTSSTTDAAAASSPRPPKKRKCDVVQLNVGGKSFTSSVVTLASNSTYFEALFSKEWREDDDTPVFVDQDSDPFSVLLSFMRLGSVNCKDLDVKVLLQAEFLGVSTLLAAVKCVAYCNLNPEFAGNDDEAVAAFDSEYQSIQQAVSSSILPRYLMERKKGRKEYARLVGYYTQMQCLTGVCDIVVQLRAPAYIADPASEEKDSVETGVVAECRTFLDALNWLSRNGFTSREEGIEKIEVQNGNDDLLLLTFSRHKKAERSVGELHLKIINDGKTREEDGWKEYAIFIACYLNECVIRADVGEKNEERITGDAGDSVCTSRISTIQGINNVQEAMNWLQKESYTERESSMEKLYGVVVTEIAPSLPLHPLEMQIYSRTIMP